jgi:hypothetical protein
MTVILSTEPNDAAIRYILYNKADISKYLLFLLMDPLQDQTYLPVDCTFTYVFKGE